MINLRFIKWISALFVIALFFVIVMDVSLFYIFPKDGIVSTTRASGVCDNIYGKDAWFQFGCATIGSGHGYVFYPSYSLASHEYKHASGYYEFDACLDTVIIYIIYSIIGVLLAILICKKHIR